MYHTGSPPNQGSGFARGTGTAGGRLAVATIIVIGESDRNSWESELAAGISRSKHLP